MFISAWKKYNFDNKRKQNSAVFEKDHFLWKYADCSDDICQDKQNLLYFQNVKAKTWLYSN